MLTIVVAIIDVSEVVTVEDSVPVSLLELGEMVTLEITD